jgi:hypothetical protein
MVDGPGRLEGLTPPIPGGGGAAEPGGKPGRFAEILDDLRRLEAENAGAQVAPAEERGLDPAELGRRVDQAEKTFRKAMEIHRDLAEYWQRARNPYSR